MNGKIDDTKKLLIRDDGKKIRINQKGITPMFSHM